MNPFRRLLTWAIALSLTGLAGAQEPESWWTGPWTVAGKAAPDAQLEATNRLNFLVLVGPATNTSVVAARKVRSPSEADVVLRVGSDDGLTVKLDGTVVWRNPVDRALLVDEDHVFLHLTKGEHSLEFQVDQGLGDWGLEAHLVALATEQADAKKFPARNLVLRASAVGSKLQGMVSPEPAFAVGGQFRLTMTLPEGRSTTTGPLSLARPWELDVPSTSPTRPAPGYLLLSAQGVGPQAPLKSATVLLPLAGWDAVLHEMAARARKAAGGADKVMQATYEFLADQMEGRVQPALATSDRQRLAAQSFLGLESARVTELKRLPAGTWQLAHRSLVDESIQPFSLSLPDLKPNQRARLLITLHGHGGTDAQAVQMGASGRQGDLITAAAFGRGDLGYHVLGEADVLEVLSLVEDSWPIDLDRVYLSGSSMGGLGTWRLGQMFSDKFAAIVPFAGWTETSYLANLRNVSTTIIHGTADPVVPINPDRMAAAALNDLGFPVRLISLEGADHNAWGAFTRSEGSARLNDLLLPAVRKRWPKEVSVTALHLRYRSNTWTRLEELDKTTTLGSLKATVQDSRHVSVQTTNLRAFSLDLTHPDLATTGRLVLDVNGRLLSVDAGPRWVTFEASAASAAFRAVPADSPTALAHDGGGLTDLFYRPLLIVYGTQGGHEALWKTVATAFSDWSVGPEGGVGTKGGVIPVVRDVDVTPAQLSSHSILLLGSSDENRLAASVAAKLPFRASGQRATLGKQGWDRAGMLATAPSPWTPNQLVAWLSLPFDARAAEAVGVSLAQSLRSYSRPGHDVTSTLYPDIAIFGPDLTPIYQANFDRHWALRPNTP